MIVVGGEALVDLVPVDFDGMPALAPRLGGGPFNAAIAARRLGAHVAFLSRVSTDGFGNRAIERLTEEGIDVSLVQRGGEPTTLAVADVTDAGSVKYSFYVEGTADRLVTDPGPLPADTKAVVLGTVSMVLEPGATAYDAVLQREAQAGRLTVLDPNIRAALIHNPAEFRERFATRLGDTRVLKVSLDDVEWLAETAGGLESALPVLRNWLGRGPDAIIVTLGADGLAALTSAGEIRVPGVPTTVVDTIGAGDTVLGAFVAWLAVNREATVEAVRAMSAADWTDALTFAATAAAVTVSRAGADPPYAREVTS